MVVPYSHSPASRASSASSSQSRSPVSGGRVDLPVKSDNATTVHMATPQSFPLELDEAVVQTIYRPGPRLHVTATANSGTYSQDGF